MTDNAYSFGSVVLAPGDAAPTFTLPDADGNPVSLADYAGRRVVLFFYPKAATPGLHDRGVRLPRLPGQPAGRRRRRAGALPRPA